MNNRKMVDNNNELAILAAGCFWCLESDMTNIDGVIDIDSGYIGGNLDNPSYDDICTGTTGHIEAVRIVFDSSIISYSELLSIYWRLSDPTRSDGQFCDIGTQYRPAIFYCNNKQKEEAYKSKDEAQKNINVDKEIVTEILKANNFYKAESYHQKYYKKNPIRYKAYRYSSGRDKKLSELWD